MAEIFVLGSSSKGNGYVIDCNGDRLILEAGCRKADMLKACKYNVGSIHGVLVTHRHNDHALYARDYSTIGVPFLAPGDVIESKGITSRSAIAVIPGRAYKVGNFTIQPLKAFHDVDCVSWVIWHAGFGRIVFATDTCSFPYHVKNVRLWMIEANYSDDILERRVDDGSVTYAMRNRLMTTHMEIGNTIRILKENKDYMRKEMDAIQCILLHLSDDNSDARDFKARVFKEARMKAVVASAGKRINPGLF